ncbi:hypothetical protein B6N60_05285 [Richelia sinica FACHB-800]|uniref:Uncharacterized protein n=1 Tax=Richelia sinica FACHB-800 TaxID=1357546 RepID=A0A975TE69_9NOST|nr:hypothetical protein B6N60_05285 [Richelia sinica FACHB-800]
MIKLAANALVQAAVLGDRFSINKFFPNFVIINTLSL